MYIQHIILDFEMNPVAKGSKVRAELKREIIEIGAVKLNERFDVVDRFSCLVNPQYNVEVNEYVTRLTGITSAEVHKAKSFAAVLKMFAEWIGEGKIRIYSWSDSDLIQLRDECMHKGLEVPANMKRWVDFQPIYPRLMKIKSYHPKMSLHDAAEWYGLDFETKSAHRALYDAEITADLVRAVLTGDYKQQLKYVDQYITRDEEPSQEAFSMLGDLCKGLFSQFLQQMPQEPQLAG